MKSRTDLGALHLDVFQEHPGFHAGQVEEASQVFKGDFQQGFAIDEFSAELLYIGNIEMRQETLNPIDVPVPQRVLLRLTIQKSELLQMGQTDVRLLHAVLDVQLFLGHLLQSVCAVQLGRLMLELLLECSNLLVVGMLQLRKSTLGFCILLLVGTLLSSDTSVSGSVGRLLVLDIGSQLFHIA